MINDGVGHRRIDALVVFGEEYRCLRLCVAGITQEHDCLVCSPDCVSATRCFYCILFHFPAPRVPLSPLSRDETFFFP